jgi:Uracil DNA glycosylase superfamily
MAATFDEGFRRPYDTLVRDAPGADVYPPDAFRTEWGPIFHRGRLDGSARVLVLGQDPATHETICRRILVGEAGQRMQGLLAKLGITRSYVLINTFLYSVYGQGGGTRHVDDDGIVAYRNRWLDTLVRRNRLDAIVTLGQLADVAYRRWLADTSVPGAGDITYGNVIHPTYPESASATGSITKAAAMARLTASWNDALTALRPAVTPDAAVDLVPYGAAIARADLAPIPPADLPAGLPPWMCALDAWASRTGADPQAKRATISVTIPRAARTWPVLPVKKAASKPPRRAKQASGATGASA